MPPVLTIAVPTYNRADDLDNLLASIVREVETAPPGSVEVLVSDNASEDHTPAVVAKHCRNCALVKSVRNVTNIGMQGNFAQIMHGCAGEYLYMIGDDEVLVNGALAVLLDSVRSGQASVYVFNYTHEGFPDWPKFLRRVAGRPIDTNPGTLKDFVFRHGWFWTLGNLGMVAVKAAPLKTADLSPHMAHTFMQAGVYLEVFRDAPMLFVDRPVFHTFIRSQTLNKQRWEQDGNVASWPATFDSLQHLIDKEVLPPLLPILFFNHCSCEWQPTWGMFLERMLHKICAGNMNVGEGEWENTRRWIGKLDDVTRREKIILAVDAMQTAFNMTKMSHANFTRLANLLLPTVRGL